MPRRRVLLVAAAVAFAALLPFARGLLLGRSLYFRDLSLQFMPLRLFALEGLRGGELRQWNPYTHEGEPLAPPALAYPLDLLQLLRPDALGISWSLALHVPMAALTFLAFALARGLPLPAAAGGALVYALGGFALSSVNLYVYVQALAWAPLVVLGLARAAAGRTRDVALGAIPIGLCLSTNGVELTAQAIAIGLLLAPATRAGVTRLLASLALGTALAAFAWLPMSGLVPGSAREAGFPTAVVLAHSVHPLTLLQTFVAGFYGDPGHLTGRWWGINFFTRGFPYVLSLYLGAGSLLLALLGLSSRHALRLRLAAIALVATIVCLGRYVGLTPLVDLVGALHAFRYPTKAFFSVHFAVAALAAIGLGHLLERGPAAWRRFALLAAGAGLLLAAAPLLPRLLPRATRWFLAGFCPPEYNWPLRESVGAFVTRDAATGGLVLLALAGLAALAALRRLDPGMAAAGCAALIAADLLRAGGGLNPSVTREFFALSPETARLAATLKAQHGRVFSCGIDFSPAYLEARLRRGGDHESLTFAAYEEILAPDFNVPFAVRSALSIDRTMLVPETRVSSPEESRCLDLAALMPRLRAAAVSHVLSLDPLEHPALEPLAVLEPRRIAPLRIQVYALRDALPYAEVRGAAGRVLRVVDAPGALALEVEAGADSTLVVREAHARGWRADVDGRVLPLGVADGRHLSVSLPAGASRVTLRYRMPLLELGAALSAAAALACAWLLRSR
jgi:hypothetical protein